MEKGKSRSCSGDEEDFEETQPVRADTPGPMPQFQYSKPKLMDLAETYGAKLRPKCLNRNFDNVDGVWDPEKWSRSFGGGVGGSRESSPLTVTDPRERRKLTETDREQLLRRRPSDPRERLKEERDGIVLSPQRRSFGTGCHVTQTSSIGRQVSCPADFKDGIDRDRDRRERRIGSGRINIDRDQGREREYRNVRDRYERDDRRGSNTSGTQERSFERSDRFHNTSYDNNRTNYREGRFSRDPRDSRMNRRGGRFHEEEEPEWFSAGPTSQSDTIELRGFEKEAEPEEEAEQEGREECVIEEEEETHAETDDKTGISVGDRNGSLETNESSSPEVNHETRPSPSNSALFDFNDFFKVNNIPIPLLDEQQVEHDVTTTGSRFSRLFMTQQQQQQLVHAHAHSKDNSRRSSINEEFNYLNDIIDGSKSPVIPSPPNAAQFYDKAGHFYANYPLSMEEKQAHIEALAHRKNSPSHPAVLNALFMNSAHMEKSNTPTNSGNFSTQDAEAQLKAMLFRGRDSNSSSGTASPATMGGAPRKVKTLAELEAAFHHESPTSNMSPVHHQQSQMQQHQAAHTPQQPQVHHNHHVIQDQREAAQHQHQQHLQQQQQQQQQLQQHLQKAAQQGQARRTSDDGDLTAFNKLLSMMQAGAAAAVSGQQMSQQQQQQQQQQSHVAHEQAKHPQMMMTPNARPVSPLQQQLQNMQMHNNSDFLQVGYQALLRNKEQQLQIQQQTLQQMHQRQQASQHSAHNQQPQPPQPMITPQQQMQQQQQQQPQTPRAITQDPILNFIQQNPTIITKPPSPSPNIPTLMTNPSTPRVVSPSPQSLPPNLLPKQVQSQQMAGAKIPSPIMFSQQPPMHLSAPSPIHPAQLARSLASQALSANTLSTASANIRPQNVARVPSPQELIAHTQAIMQSALIKKQLEDQKERFLKKQQERARSPNQNKMNASPNQNQVTQGGQNKTTMSPAFTPTSVMRKMHSDRATEKEKETKDNDNGSDLTIDQWGLPEDFGKSHDGTNPDKNDKYKSAELARQDAEEIASLPGIDFSAEPNQPMTSLEEKLKLAGISGQSGNKSMPILGQGDKSVRPLVGQGTMQGNIPIQVQSVASSTPLPGRPIVKGPTGPPTPMISASQVRQVTGGPGAVSTPVRPDGHRAIVGSTNGPAIDLTKVLEQQRLQQQTAAAAAAARQAATTPIAGRPVGVGANTPFGIPITGRLPVQSNVPPPPNVAANALLMQQMMQQQSTAAARGEGQERRLNLNQLNQFNQLNQLAAIQQAQQRMVDPRLQNVRYPGIVPGMLNPRSTATTNMGGLGVTNNPAINAVLGRALSPQILQGGGQKLGVNGPLSPNLSCTSPAQFINTQAALNGNNNITKTSTATSDPNILKWFSSDVLKNHMPTMPPLPTQGQKVLTVDDLEGT